ncbi:MAG: hypothetical protein Q9208_001422 [Pyrenodesmia sp. 3 TL-2023]
MATPNPKLPPEPRLLVACRDGDHATLCSLVESQDDPPHGCGVLLGVAASKGHPDIVRFLLTKYNKQQLPVDSHHALMATYSGLECYRLICEREPALLNSFFTYQGNALQQAVSRSNLDLLNFILEKGGDPGRVITDETPLWQLHFIPIETAALCASVELAKTLIRHGASLEGTAALDFAAGHKRRMRLDMVVCLVEAGADVNATSRESHLTHGRPNWGPPLQSAIEAQHAEVVQYLLDHGASPWVLNASGENAYYKAWEVENEQISQLLAATRRAQ